MIRINLLPFRSVRRIENIQQEVIVFLLSLFIVAGGLFWYQGVLGRKVIALDAAVRQTNQEVERLKKKVDEINEIKKILDVLNKKIAVINNLEMGRRGAVILLENMNRTVIPKRMWVTNFQEKGARLEIQGIALDNKTVADFMTRLETAYTGVTLKNLKLMTMRKVTLKSFYIKCKKRPAVVKAAPDKAEK
ncbi:PilN domain-containing protein [Thermodesulfobacteriota bacterium]